VVASANAADSLAFASLGIVPISAFRPTVEGRAVAAGSVYICGWGLFCPKLATFPAQLAAESTPAVLLFHFAENAKFCVPKNAYQAAGCERNA
jgi:hypothetical protein